MKDFFISYNHNRSDNRWARWIAWILEDEGYDIILDQWDFLTGDLWLKKMHEAASQSRFTVGLFSPDTLTSDFVWLELSAALAKQRAGNPHRLIPILVRKLDDLGIFSGIKCADVSELVETEAREAVLKAVARTRNKPSSPPGFPAGQNKQIRDNPSPRFPGALPPVWNVPHSRNRNFTGREEYLSKLEEALDSERVGVLSQAAIHGLGGIGKTQIALEYIYRHIADYETVWWTRSELGPTRRDDYAALGAELEVPGLEFMAQPELIQAVRRALGGKQGWLLVFDNVENPSDIRDLIPEGGKGHVIATSRNPTFGVIAEPIKVKEFKEQESVEFMGKRTGREDDAGFRALSKELGDFPLALEQAAAYLEETGCSASDYLALFKKRQKKLLARSSELDAYEKSVATTWEITSDRFRDECPVATELMNLFAFFAPDRIPLDVIREGAKFLPRRLTAAIKDGLRFDKALANLNRYSLIDREGDNVSVHRLLQAVARNRLPSKRRGTLAKAVVELLNDAFPQKSHDVRTWSQCAQLIDHALVAGHHAEDLGLASDALGRLLNQAGGYLSGRADFWQSKDCHERALEIDERVYGPNHPEVATDVNNLGDVLRALGDLEGAKGNCERALAISEASFGPNHPNVATCVNNLGLVLKDMGDLKGAKDCYERALAIDEAAFGPKVLLEIIVIVQVILRQVREDPDVHAGSVQAVLGEGMGGGFEGGGLHPVVHHVP